jgi:uncharacterized protein (UPF0335 family)
MTEEIQKEKRTEEQIIDDMYDQLLQIDKYNEILKEYKTEAKEAGYDAALLAKVAKARVDDKTEELKDKTEKLLELLED